MENDNHLFITLEDNRVTYRTTNGSQGGVPTSVWTHDEAVTYLKELYSPTSVEIRDDRTPPAAPGSTLKRIAIEALEILGACLFATIIALIAFYFYFYH
jgi:hypothetical protein